MAAREVGLLAVIPGRRLLRLDGEHMVHCYSLQTVMQVNTFQSLLHFLLSAYTQAAAARLPGIDQAYRGVCLVLFVVLSSQFRTEMPNYLPYSKNFSSTNISGNSMLNIVLAC